MNNQRSLFFNVDWFTVFLYLALCIIGWFNIHSAIFDEEHPSYIDISTNYGKQFIYIISAALLALVILLMESRFFSALAPAVYTITVILLIIVLVIGQNVGGNQAWIPLGGGFKLQPSEFAKFATCLMLARYLSGTNIKVTDTKSFFVAAAIIIFPMMLIMLQPDAGSTLVFCSLIFVLYREGISPLFLIGAALAIALFILTLLLSQYQAYFIGSLVAIAGLLVYLFRRNQAMVITVVTSFVLSIALIFSVNFLFHNVLKQHQTVRIEEWLGITKDLRGIGYNVNQSKIAIGSGKLWGKGYLKGTQTKFSFVPEQSTDFIFCTVGEEWGFVGTVSVLIIYLIMLFRIVFIAERQRSNFSRIYGYGVASIIFFHVFINVGMTIGIVPVIGIPLPLISYGGSSLWSFTILIFILLKLDSNRMGII